MIKRICSFLSQKMKNVRKKEVAEKEDSDLAFSQFQEPQALPLLMATNSDGLSGYTKNPDQDSKHSVQIVIDMVNDEENENVESSSRSRKNSDCGRSSDCGYSSSSFTHRSLGVPTVSNYSDHSSLSSSSSCNSWSNLSADFTFQTDEEIMPLIHSGEIPLHQLESALKDEMRAVVIRRDWHSSIDPVLQEVLISIPFEDCDYKSVNGACCENVIGLIPLPLTVVGPARINGVNRHIPLATSDILLIKRIHQGFRAFDLDRDLNLELDPDLHPELDPYSANGINSHFYSDGISRGPVLQFPDAASAVKFTEWSKVSKNLTAIQESFDMTSRFLKLTQVKVQPAGRLCFIRFVAKTGDAMGMNMISKGTLEALKVIQDHFTEMEVISVSGNYCTDKKPAAINWIQGRGKSVVAEGRLLGSIIQRVFKTSAEEMVKINSNAVLMGPIMSGTVGGFNCNAARICAAIFAATGQDVAQIVEGSNCLTLMELVGPKNEDLHVTCTLPSIEVGSVGGGTILPPQNSCLQMLDLFDQSESSQSQNPGETAQRLAKIVAATVLAGELAITASLARESRDFENDYSNSDSDYEYESDLCFRDLDCKKN